MTEGWKFDDYVIAIGAAIILPTQLVMTILTTLWFYFGIRILL